MTAAVYRTSALNGRYRRSKTELAEIDAAIYEICEAEHPISIRGVFYRMVSRHLVPKTDGGVNNGYGVVQRRALKMRRTGGA